MNAVVQRYTEWFPYIRFSNRITFVSVAMCLQLTGSVNQIVRRERNAEMVDVEETD